MKVISTHWFTSGIYTMGIVVLENDMKERKARIAVCPFNKSAEECVQHLIDWGAKVPESTVLEIITGLQPAGKGVEAIIKKEVKNKDPEAIIDITESLQLIMHDDMNKEAYVPCLDNCAYGFSGLNDFLKNLIDHRGYNFFRYKGKVYTYGWDDDFYFTENIEGKKKSLKKYSKK